MSDQVFLRPGVSWDNLPPARGVQAVSVDELANVLAKVEVDLTRAARSANGTGRKVMEVSAVFEVIREELGL